jgi:gliding motility-associated-like protein
VTYENRTFGRDTSWKWQWIFVDSLYVKGSLGQDSFILESFKPYFTESANHVHPFYVNFSKSKVILFGDNKYGCRDTSDLFVTNVDTTPTLVITPRADTTICFGESVQYTVSGSDTVFYKNFQWGNKISGDSIVLFTPRNTITYTVYGKTPQCPPIGKDIKITVVPPVETKIATEPQYILQGAVSRMKLITNGILDSLKWTPDSTLTRPRSDSTGATPSFTTTYRVKLYYSLKNYMCSQEDSATIFVNRDCQVDSLKIPTAFSPNGDGLNDEFYLKSFALKTILSFNVYNRWGNKVFSVNNVPADDKQYYWNGKINNSGDEVPLGVFVYNISAVCKNDQILNFQGEITVLR